MFTISSFHEMEMVDDIDDLLNEIESTFLTSGGGDKQPKQTSSYSQRLSKTSKNKRPERGISSDNDVDAMIKEICQISDKGTQLVDVKHRHRSEPNYSDHKTASDHPGLHHKCHPVYLGGGNDAKGLGTAINKRVCENLRCTNCDFQVAVFDNFKWHPRIDYLFLRNNMPDFDKLRTMLITKKGYRAYSCQCNWHSVNELTNLQTVAGLKWVCGKH